MKKFCAQGILDFFLPRICASCKCKLISEEQFICNDCNLQLEIVTHERIIREFNRKFLNDEVVNDFITHYIFKEDSVIQRLIHSIKYDQNYHIGKFLAQSIFTGNSTKLRNLEADYIVPVPLHHLRRAERGYNQAAEIAKQLSKRIGVTYRSNIIKRNRFTMSQTKFTLDERKKNIQGAFRINNRFTIRDKVFLLVDDVITTGATVSECAKILIENDARSVTAVSAAIAD